MPVSHYRIKLQCLVTPWHIKLELALTKVKERGNTAMVVISHLGVVHWTRRGALARDTARRRGSSQPNM